MSHTVPTPSGGVGVVLVAGGLGTRLGAAVPKALVPVGGIPLVAHALRRVLAATRVRYVVVTAPPGHQDAVREAVRGREGSGDAEVTVVPGGAERRDSVARGLAALPAQFGTVLVHDAARAFTPTQVVDRVIDEVLRGRTAVTPAVPVTDTIKQVAAGPDGVETVTGTLDRSVLRAVQTPQGFTRDTLERAHAEVSSVVTDDCGMVEAMGGTVHLVPGSWRSLKVTTPHDLEVAEGWLAREQTGPVLIVLGGAPGVGKTTLARVLARRTGATHLRGDSIEQALVRSGVIEGDRGIHGYAVAYAVAADQLALGGAVVADLVNGPARARRGWEDVGRAAGARVLRVLVRCTDTAEHQRRVETRVPDIPGHRLPDWAAVQSWPTEPWPEADLVVDTSATEAQDLAGRVLARLADLAAGAPEEAR